MDGQQPDSQSQPQQFKPGEMISPARQPASPAPTRVETPQPAAPAVASPAPASTPVPAAAVTTQPAQSAQAPEPSPQSAIQAEQPPAGYEQTPDPASQTQPTDQPQPDDVPGDAISWTASEFVEYHKGGGWHIGLVLASIVVAVIVWFIIKDIITPIVIVLAGIALSVYGAKRPRQLDYQLTSSGLDIGHKHYGFGEFKAFSVVPEGGLETIVLTPTKRFMPLTTIYFDPKDGDTIADMISLHLPYKERQPDPIDKMLNKLRF